MIGTYKEFYRFVKENNPYICAIWEDFNNRPDPQVGDEFLLYYSITEIGVLNPIYVIFDKVLLDSKFKNGVAFYYIFHDKKTNEEIKVRSINSVDNIENLTFDDKIDLYGFWKRCHPVKDSDK